MSQRQQTIAIAVTALIVALFAWGYDYFELGAKPDIDQSSAQYDPAKVWIRTLELTATKNAVQHFEKHKDEFGFVTLDQYIQGAVNFINNPSKDILRNRQRDGDYAYYNPKTAEYAVMSSRARIRTYFKLDPKIHGYPTNLDYFKAQAKNAANDNGKAYKRPPSLQ